jgi:hypothetical protein
LVNTRAGGDNLVQKCRMRQSCTENLNAFRGVFKMSDNENISMREINNNSILNTGKKSEIHTTKFAIAPLNP